MAGQTRNLRAHASADGIYSPMTPSGIVYTGTYANGIVLTNPATQNRATVAATGYVTNNTMAYNGDAIYGAPLSSWTVTNLGAIKGGYSPYSTGVDLKAGGSVTNGEGGSAGALIAGYHGVGIVGGSGTVVNFGTIEGKGVLIPYYYPIISIGDGVFLGAGGSVTNGQSGSSTGLIAGGYLANGVFIGGGSGTVTNFGTIDSGELGTSVLLAAGGSVTNGQSDSSGGLITGWVGVKISANGTLTNFGTISAVYGVIAPGSVANFGTVKGVAEGIILDAGGSTANGQSGSITGDIGVLLSAGSVANFGTISGERDGVEAFSGTVTNAGAIIGNRDAVLFGAGDDLLVVDPGAVFVGKVDGGAGNNTLELAQGTGTGMLSGLGTSFVNFGTVVFDAGAPWTVTLDDPAAFTGTIWGFANGDFIDLTGRIADGVNYSGGVLTVLNGPNVVAAINLAGPYTSADFSLSPDGLGGTDIGLAEPTLTLFGQSAAAGSHAASISSAAGTDLAYEMTLPEAADLSFAPHH